jgi:hypothetical protein
MAGELVMRPPISSAKYAAISTTSLWLKPTSEIRLIVMDSAATAALDGGATAAIDEVLRNKHAQKTASFIRTTNPLEFSEPHPI